MFHVHSPCSYSNYYVLRMYFVCISDVFPMYFFKTCIYFSCIPHVFFQNMYFPCISHVFLMYFFSKHVFLMYFPCIYHVYLMYFYNQLEEFVTKLIGYKLSNANHVLKLLQFMPVDYNLVKRVITSFNNLHYDKDTGILHSLTAARIHELRN